MDRKVIVDGGNNDSFNRSYVKGSTYDLADVLYIFYSKDKSGIVLYLKDKQPNDSNKYNVHPSIDSVMWEDNSFPAINKPFEELFMDGKRRAKVVMVTSDLMLEIISLISKAREEGKDSVVIDTNSLVYNNVYKHQSDNIIDDDNFNKNNNDDNKEDINNDIRRFKR